MGWTVQGWNSGVGENLQTHSDQPQGLSCLLYNGYQALLLRLKQPRRGGDQPSLLATESSMGGDITVLTPCTCLAYNMTYKFLLQQTFTVTFFLLWEPAQQIQTVHRQTNIHTSYLNNIIPVNHNKWSF